MWVDCPPVCSLGKDLGLDHGDVDDGGGGGGDGDGEEEEEGGGGGWLVETCAGVSK